MPQMQEIYKCEALVLAQTEKAVKIEVDGEELWIPRSHLIDADELPHWGNTQIKMTAWIAKEKGLI